MDLDSVIVTELLEAVTVYSPKNRRAEMKNRPSYGISLCIGEGRIVYTHRGKEYVEDKMHAVILPMGESYSLRGEASGYFPVINFKTLLPLTDTVTVLEVQNPELLAKCFQKLQDVFSMGKNRNKAFSLLYEILNELSSPKTPAVLAPAIQLLHSGYCSPLITNALLASRANISEVYFRRLFRESLGVSPKQYILSLRMQKAKHLLSDGRLKISAIAAASGFESPAHFCRAFKKEVGLSPSVYRQKHQVCKI